MVELLASASTEELSPRETEVLENYRHVGRLLELMKSKARRPFAGIREQAMFDG
jgi:hypothetical protein